MRESVLAVDFGTSYFKAALVGERGDILALHRAPTPIARDGVRSEIDPGAFKRAVRAAARALAGQSPQGLSGVRAVCFSTQANTFTLLDAADRPLAPFIVWDDGRAKPLAPALLAMAREPGYSARSGIPELHHHFAVAKVRWLVEHEPSLRHQTRRMLFLGDFFTHWLTGRHVTDGSVAALSGLFDVEDWHWSSDWCARVGVDASWLPEVVRGGTSVGVIRPDAAAELGLPAGCRLIMGCLDQYAGAIGLGNDRPGGLSETTGTVLATVCCAGTFHAATAPGAFRGPAASPGTFYHMTFGDVSASLLEHYRQQLPDLPPFEELDRAATEPSSRHLKLDHRLPADELKTVLRSWAGTEPRGAVVRCIYETVAAALADQIRQLNGTLPAAMLRCAGGAARSRCWLQVKADTLGLPVLAPQTPEPALIGAASLAAVELHWPPLARADGRHLSRRLILPQNSRR